MLVSDYIVQTLVDRGVGVVFGYQGGNISRVIDSISRRVDIRFVQTYHEQGAAFAAGGFARAAGRLGVAVASSGPGALNLMTGVADAWFDAVPCLFIVGDLSRIHEKSNPPPRQGGFQAADIVSVAAPITKYAAKVVDPASIPYHIGRALYECEEGRQGPALLSIPHWVQGAECPCVGAQQLDTPSGAAQPKLDVKRIQRLLAESQRPVLLVGGGARSPQNRRLVGSFLRTRPLPVVASLCGLDVVPHGSPHYVGFIGDYGHRAANLALAASDCVLVLGSRLDERQTNCFADYMENKVILHIDRDPTELWPEKPHYIPINADIGDVLPQLEVEAFSVARKWTGQIAKWLREYPRSPETSNRYPHEFLRRLSLALPRRTSIFADVGTHQMCAAQALWLEHGLRLFNSGGLGSMGFALPAAIGSTFASGNRMTLCLCGDGGLQMNLQELQTLSREKCNVKIVLLNNHGLGMIRELQTRVLEGRFFGSFDGYSACDFEKVAHAFDLPYARISPCSGLPPQLAKEGPALIEVDCIPEMAPTSCLTAESMARELSRVAGES